MVSPGPSMSPNKRGQHRLAQQPADFREGVSNAYHVVRQVRLESERHPQKLLCAKVDFSRLPFCRQKATLLKEDLSVLMFCAPVFLFTSGSSAHVVVYRSDCRYRPYSTHVSEFMPICFTRKWTKHGNTRSPPTKMAADGY